MESNEVEQNQSWASLAFLWTGAMISVPGLLLGGTLIGGMPFWEAILTAVIGYGIVVVLMVFQGIQGSDLKLPTVRAASQVFGEQGSKKIISIILAIACLGWFGIQANVCGAAFSSFLAVYGIDFPVWISSLIWGIIMLASAIYGIKMLTILNYIAVPILLIACGYALIISIQDGAFTDILNYTPETTLPFLSGLSVTVGSFALGAVIAGDYSQYTKGRSNIVKSSVYGILPSGILMIGIGAILTLTSGTADITSVFNELGMPVLGVIALILAAWTTNAVNAFSGGIAIINVFGISKQHEKTAIAIAGGIGTVLAVFGILNYFIPIMSVLSAMIPPVAGVMIASYWIVQKGDSTKWQSVSGVNWVGVLSWATGAIVAGLPVIFTFFPSLPQLPNQPLIGIVISFVMYLILDKLIEDKANSNVA